MAKAFQRLNVLTFERFNDNAYDSVVWGLLQVAGQCGQQTAPSPRCGPVAAGSAAPGATDACRLAQASEDWRGQQAVVAAETAFSPTTRGTYRRARNSSLVSSASRRILRKRPRLTSWPAWTGTVVTRPSACFSRTWLPFHRTIRKPAPSRARTTARPLVVGRRLIKRSLAAGPRTLAPPGLPPLRGTAQ